MIDRTFGITSAAPTPWASRAATSAVGLPAAPHAAEASVNTPRPIEKVRRRPIRSPSRAAVIRNTAEVRANPATTHSIAPVPACSSRCIEGSATFTMKKSRTTMNVPVRSTGSAVQRVASAGKARPPVGTANVDELDCVVMPATVTAGVRTVDYPVGNAITSPVSCDRGPGGRLQRQLPLPGLEPARDLSIPACPRYAHTRPTEHMTRTEISGDCGRSPPAPVAPPRRARSGDVASRHVHVDVAETTSTVSAVWPWISACASAPSARARPAPEVETPALDPTAEQRTADRP